ncbi:hypothetical protein SKAU_G00331890 [Synaphobranchus kaupii]|uniref:Uncharacterized protein n=1 Tax=Synaphobranchus kaupii TaxID=118154 RepID=A0A9Q1ELC1_SYNKA|nr:hypothetical protein SKAU_G00331890 [Synaphobranchus kaupii]
MKCTPCGGAECKTWKLPVLDVQVGVIYGNKTCHSVSSSGEETGASEKAGTPFFTSPNSASGLKCAVLHKEGPMIERSLPEAWEPCRTLDRDSHTRSCTRPWLIKPLSRSGRVLDFSRPENMRCCNGAETVAGTWDGGRGGERLSAVSPPEDAVILKR